ncbi:MAG: hypothetical protein WAM65_13175 [Candidatus Korobacteraceae bacterium]
MSGYLGRMLQLPAPGERRLHPFAGSVYGERDTSTARPSGMHPEAARRDGEKLPLLEREQTVMSSPPPAQVAKTHPPDAMAFLDEYEPLQPQRRESRQRVPASRESRDPARTDREASPEHDAERSIPQHSPQQSTTRRLYPSNETSRVAANVRTAINAEDGPSQTPALRPDGIAADLGGLADKRSAANAESGQIVQTRGELVPREKKQELALRQPLPTARKTNTPQRGPARDAHTEGPEVQIHIGRIEVLAVQPPAPAAPAPRRERTTSLADYLARQNGRGR